MQRATTIEFDDARQLWIVRSPDGREMFTHPRRQTCLNWEREHLEATETMKHNQ